MVYRVTDTALSITWIFSLNLHDTMESLSCYFHFIDEKIGSQRIMNKVSHLVIAGTNV